MTATSTRPGRAGREHTDVRNAWLSLLLLPIAFALSFFVGEGLISLLGHPVGAAEQAPLWAILLASVPAILVFFVPAGVAAVFARRAAQRGDRRGWVPAAILLLVALAFLAQNVAAF